MRKQSVVTLTFMLTLAFSLSAQQGFQKMNNPEAFKKKVSEIAQITQTIQSTFVQEKQLSFMQEKIITKGVFYFKKEKQLRWEYNDPYSYVIILNEDVLYIKDDGNLNQIDMKSNKTFKEINEMMTRSLQGDILAENDKFSYELLESQYEVLVKLTPIDKEMKEYISQVDLYFDKNDLMVARIDMHESGDLTTIQFTNRKMNEPVGEGLFSKD